MLPLHFSSQFCKNKYWGKENINSPPSSSANQIVKSMRKRKFRIIFGEREKSGFRAGLITLELKKPFLCNDFFVSLSLIFGLYPSDKSKPFPTPVPFSGHGSSRIHFQLKFHEV